MSDAGEAGPEQAIETAVISPDGAIPRVFGSGSTQWRLQRPDGELKLVPDEEPPALVSVPDIAFQFTPCVNSLASGLEDSMLAAIRDAFPGADVRTLCRTSGRRPIQSQRVGIWMRPPVQNTDDEQVRTAGLESLSLLKPDEDFAAFVNEAYIRGEAFEAFAKMPKRLKKGGAIPDRHGPIHLTRLDVVFEAPDRIITTVDGYDDRLWPGVDFRLTTTDRPSASGGQLRVDTHTNLDTDTGWLADLALATLGLGLFVSGWFLLATVVVAGLGGYVAVQSASPTGVLAGSVATRFPSKIMLPYRLALAMNYQRVSVTVGGLFAGGSADLYTRTTAAATIQGRRRFWVRAGGRIRSRYEVTTDELRGPLRIAWKVDGLVLGRGGRDSALVLFRAANARPGQVLQRRVHVTVTDADGLSAEAEVIVDLIVVGGAGSRRAFGRLLHWLAQRQSASHQRAPVAPMS